MYNQHLTPEMRRITTDAWGRWGKDYCGFDHLDDNLSRQGAAGEHEQGGKLQLPQPNPTPTPNGVILDESGIGMEVMSILLMIFLLQDFFTGGCQGGDDQEDTIGQEQEMRDQWETKELQNFCTLNIAI